MLALKNKIVCITGASSGIGEACAKYFAREGAKLILCARRLDALNNLAKQLHETFSIDIHVWSLDVCDLNQVSQAFQSLPKNWSDIDILINNAGLALGLDLIQDADIADWDTMIDTNLKGLLYVTHQVLKPMLKRNAGHIINIGSVAGHQVYPKGAVYCATKFGVNAITQGLKMDLLGTKIRVSSVDPGAVHTNLSMVRFKGDKNRADAVYAGMDPLTADDVADVVLYCATRPAHVNINEVIMMPTAQASATMIDRFAQ